MLIDRRLVQQVLLTLSLGLLFFDALTGFVYFRFGVNSNLSTIYKLIFVFLCIVYCFENSRTTREYKLMLVAVIFCLLWATAININANRISFYIKDIGDSIKLISVFVVYFTFSKLGQYDSKDFTKKFLLISTAVLVLNIVATVMGFGQSAYSNNFGAKGFFQAGNSLSSIVILISTFSFVLLKRLKEIYFYACFTFMVVIAYYIGTKSGMLGVLLSGILVILSRFKLSFRHMILISIAFLVVTYSAFWLFDFILNSVLYDRFIFMYENRGLLGALISGRDEFFRNIAPYFFNSDLLTLSFGFGTKGLAIFEKPLVEMDWFDMLFQFGFIPTFLYFSMFFVLLKDLHGIKVNEFSYNADLKSAALISTYILLCTSFISGHVLLNGVVTFFWGVLISLPKHSSSID
ncbi:O-antigen ligase family protein [Aeromonas sp. QDB66]|uniref:O-antigen ligase family protein n=1 Tax=Aeromonas sp. QDB66 TaxID=2989824 RepID=UPI0022E7E8D4|nr:O-antigen ligase family protein [Aeromonas sp. QDB66]